MTKFIVAPIDVDFAGWCLEEEGNHNAWGIIDDNPNGQMLIGHTSLKGPADKACAYLNEHQPDQPRFWFINAVDEGKLRD